MVFPGYSGYLHHWLIMTETLNGKEVMINVIPNSYQSRSQLVILGHLIIKPRITQDVMRGHQEGESNGISDWPIICIMDV